MRADMWLFIPFISIFYAIGFGLLGYSLISMKRSTAVAAWPSTVGTIVSCDLETNIDSEDGDTHTHQVKVHYKYSVSGRELTNDQLAFGYVASSGRETHQEILDKLKAADTVDVRYDPSDPQNSVLSYGVHRSIQFTLTFAVTWLSFVVGFTLLWWVSSSGDYVLLDNLHVQ